MPEAAAVALLFSHPDDCEIGGKQFADVFSCEAPPVSAVCDMPVPGGASEKTKSGAEH
jgi:hypothetical protein